MTRAGQRVSTRFSVSEDRDQNTLDSVLRLRRLSFARFHGDLDAPVAVLKGP